MSEGNASVAGDVLYLYTLPETQAHVAVTVPIWLVTCTLSALIIITIYKDKQFHTSGYILITALLLIEVTYLTIVTSLFVLGLAVRTRALRHLPDVIPTVLANLQEGLFHAIASTLMFISFQRVCCVMAPHKFSSIFTRNFTLFIILLALVIPTLYMSYLYLDGAHYVFSFHLLTLHRVAYTDYQDIIFYSFMFTIGGVSLLNYTLVFLAFVVRWRKKKSLVVNVRSHPAPPSSSAGSREVRLTSQFLVITVIYFCSLLVYLLTPYPTTPTEFKLVLLMFNICWTVIVTSDSIIYLVLNKVLRRGVWRLVRGRGQQEGASTSAGNVALQATSAGGTGRGRGRGTAVSHV